MKSGRTRRNSDRPNVTIQIGSGNTVKLVPKGKDLFTVLAMVVLLWGGPEASLSSVHSPPSATP